MEWGDIKIDPGVPNLNVPERMKRGNYQITNKGKMS